MKEKNIAEELLKQSIKIIDCMEGKTSIDDVLTFCGSHAIDVEPLKARLNKEEPKNEEVKEKAQPVTNTRAMTSKTIKNKKA